MATTRIRRSSGLSCEIARIRTRVFLTTGTFNLVVKDRTRLPPERRAIQSGRSATRALQPSSKLLRNYRLRRLAVNPLNPQDFHLLFTTGELPLDCGALLANTRRNASSAWIGVPVRHAPRRKDTVLIKDR